MGDDAHLAAQRLERDVAQVVAVEADMAKVGVVEAGHQLGDRGLAGPGGSDHGQYLAGSDLEVDFSQDEVIGVVAERDRIEHQVALDGRQVVGVGLLGDGGFGGEYPPQLRDCGAALLVLVEQLYEGLDRGEERRQEQEEGNHLAEAEFVAQHHAAADQEDHGLRDDSERLGARPVERLRSTGGEVGVEVRTDDVVVADGVVATAVEGCDEPDAIEALREVGEHVGDPVPHPQVADCRDLPKPEREDHVHRDNDSEADQRQGGVQHEQVGSDDDEGHALYDELDQSLLEQHGQRLDVAGHPGHQHPGALGGEEAERLALEVAEHPDPQFVDESFADAAGEGGAQGGRECCQHDRPDEHEGEGHEDVGVLGEHAPVDAELDE